MHGWPTGASCVRRSRRSVFRWTWRSLSQAFRAALAKTLGVTTSDVVILSVTSGPDVDGTPPSGTARRGTPLTRPHRREPTQREPTDGSPPILRWQIKARNDLRFYVDSGSTRAMDITSAGNVRCFSRAHTLPLSTHHSALGTQP